MKRIPKYFYLFLLGIIVVMPVMAADQGNMMTIITNPLKTTDTKEFIERLGNWIFTFSIAVVPVMILVAAYMFVTGGGNPTKMQSARKLLLYTLIGFAIMMMAKGIIALLATILSP